MYPSSSGLNNKRPAKEHARELLLVDQSTGDAFCHDLDHWEQQIVAQCYLSKSPSSRNTQEIESLVRYFHDKQGFTKLRGDSLEIALRESVLNRHRKGALISIEPKHAMHILSGCLLLFTLGDLESRFSLDCSANSSDCNSWLKHLDSGSIPPASTLWPGEVLFGKCWAHIQTCQNNDLLSSMVAAHGPSSVYIDPASGELCCVVAGSLTMCLTYRIPEEKVQMHEAILKERRAQRQQKLLVLQAGVKFGRGGPRNQTKILCAKYGDPPRTLPRNAIILRTNEEPTAATLVLSGQVRVVIPKLDALGPSARSLEVGRLQSDAWIGALACKDSRRQPFTYVVVSVKGARVQSVPSEKFRKEIVPLLHDDFWTRESESEAAWESAAVKAKAEALSSLLAKKPVKYRKSVQIPKEHALQCCADIGAFAARRQARHQALIDAQTTTLNDSPIVCVKSLGHGNNAQERGACVTTPEMPTPCNHEHTHAPKCQRPIEAASITNEDQCSRPGQELVQSENPRRRVAFDEECLVEPSVEQEACTLLSHQRSRTSDMSDISFGESDISFLELVSREDAPLIVKGDQEIKCYGQFEDTDIEGQHPLETSPLEDLSARSTPLPARLSTPSRQLGIPAVVNIALEALRRDGGYGIHRLNRPKRRPQSARPPTPIVDSSSASLVAWRSTTPDGLRNRRGYTSVRAPLRGQSDCTKLQSITSKTLLLGMQSLTTEQ